VARQPGSGLTRGSHGRPAKMLETLVVCYLP
jgi:hypothetical protein